VGVRCGVEYTKLTPLDLGVGVSVETPFGALGVKMALFWLSRYDYIGGEGREDC
jgi:hypothetical protein